MPSSSDDLGARGAHLVESPFPVTGLQVDGPDSGPDDHRGIPQPACVEHGFLYAIVGGDANHDDADDTARLEERLNRGGVGVVSSWVTHRERGIPVLPSRALLDHLPDDEQSSEELSAPGTADAVNGPNPSILLEVRSALGVPILRVDDHGAALARPGDLAVGYSHHFAATADIKTPVPVAEIVLHVNHKERCCRVVVGHGAQTTIIARVDTRRAAPDNARMARAHAGYRCNACGWQSSAYVGRCNECAAWNTLEQAPTDVRRGGGRTGASLRAASTVIPATTVRLADVPDTEGKRLPTGIAELDRVLGGGLVPGSLVLVGGEPGIGKSTLVLQAIALLAAAGHSVAYVCGEESPRQVRMRAGRLGVEDAAITLIPETSLESALAAAEAAGVTALVIDSIQSVYIEGLDTRSGGPAQLAEAGARLVTWAKGNEIATIITGHVTKGGEIAGPRLLEHLVDAVLYFESAEAGALRVLRAVKNRFGATDEVGVFEMTGEGLRSIDNPSAAFLEASDPHASGCAATVTIEGSRPLVVEIQALAVPSFLSTPRRIASGIETSRLHLLLAVLARRGGLNAGNLDVVATVSGGLRLRDPGTDLAVAVALASAVRDQALEPRTAFMGEVALSGAIRPVSQPARRLAELARLGFKRAIVPRGTPVSEGIESVPVDTLRDAVAAARMQGRRTPLVEEPSAAE